MPSMLNDVRIEMILDDGTDLLLEGIFSGEADAAVEKALRGNLRALAEARAVVGRVRFLFASEGLNLAEEDQGRVDVTGALSALSFSGRLPSFGKPFASWRVRIRDSVCPVPLAGTVESAARDAAGILAAMGVDGALDPNAEGEAVLLDWNGDEAGARVDLQAAASGLDEEEIRARAADAVAAERGLDPVLMRALAEQAWTCGAYVVSRFPALGRDPLTCARAIEAGHFTMDRKPPGPAPKITKAGVSALGPALRDLAAMNPENHGLLADEPSYLLRLGACAAD